VAVVVAIAVVGFATYYGKVVYDQYSDLNSRADELKEFSAYDIKPDADKLSPYEE
jgi:hypothetical protein